MKVCVLASGSKGNCTYIESGKSKILIDCGISKKRAVECLNQIGVNPQEISAIFVTHEHSDHIKGIGAFSRSFNVPVFAHNVFYQELLNKIGDISLQNSIDFFDNDFYFKDLTVSPFAVPHDSINCMGFSFYSGGEKISVSTDLGSVSPQTLEKMAGSKIVVLESNHDIDLLRANPNYPAELKARILSGSGHLSNKDCGIALHELAKTGTRDFILAHLSEDNNNADIALKDSIAPLKAQGLFLGKDFEVDIANQNFISKLHK